MLLAAFLLLIVYLFTELFSKNKKEKIKFNLKPKYFLIIFICIGIFMSVKFFPKMIGKFHVIQGFLAPFLGLVKNLIPFI